MKNESVKSIVVLIIFTILIIILASVIINYAKKMMEETKVQDLKTNMLLIQAETKKGLEEVCFQTVNLDESKEEELTKIKEIKQEFLDGIILNNAPVEVQETVKNITEVTLDENCYYLDETILTEMGIKDINKNEYGYFIVKYDFENTNVEVINTKGCNGKYTLTEINKNIDESQS